MTHLDPVISKKQLLQLVPYCPQHILRLEKQGRFPKRIAVGPGRVGWRLSKIEQWLADRAKEPMLQPPPALVQNRRPQCP